jgi:ABC-2 type transport system ATP-binding protein
MVGSDLNDVACSGHCLDEQEGYIMTPPLSVVGLKKRFSKHSPWILNGFTAEFSNGVTGFVGPNGAGKTTLFSIVAGFIKPQDGQVDILGLGSFDAQKHKGRIGVLPQDADFDLGVSPSVFLYGMARLQGFGRVSAKAETARVLGVVNLVENADKQIGKLSHGMRRRVAIASAIDEPMSGLDPVETHRLRGLILGLAADAAVVVSSHNLSELEKICDQVLFIDDGVCVEEASVGSLAGDGLIATWELGDGEFDLQKMRDVLPSHELEFSDGCLSQSAPDEESLDLGSIEIARILSASGVPIRSIRRGRSLEERYLETME